MHDRSPKRSILFLLTLSILAVSFGLIAIFKAPSVLRAAEADPGEANFYRVLSPIESGDLTIFPVVRAANSKATGWQYLTLDEGLSSGEVVVTEAGRVRGLVRNRHPGVWHGPVSGDQVNQLVLVNNSSRPLILLAGEIVTGGKQDRVIAKDRIVSPQSDPIDLSVFCIEPGRWVATSEQFGIAGKPAASFMAQPMVRKEAMVARDQQEVWNAVGGAIGGMTAAAPTPSSSQSSNVTIDGPVMNRSTTSYAKTMQQAAVEQKVDEAGQKLLQSREQILARLRQEHAVGVIAAVRGEIIWADIFADSEMLSKYWTKLIRSYAAEVLTSHEQANSPATVADAQHFLNTASSGHETSEGEVGIYRYSEMHAGNISAFALKTLLPGTDFEVHISKVRTDSNPIVHPIPWRER